MFGSEAKQKLQDHELQQQGLKYFTLYAFSSAFCFTVMILVSLGFDIFDLVSDLLNWVAALKSSSNSNLETFDQEEVLALLLSRREKAFVCVCVCVESLESTSNLYNFLID